MNSNSFNILIVDDEKDYTQIMKKVLAFEGYNIHTANSGKEALEKLNLKKYHLVLTDLMMEKINGIELLEEIQKNYKDTYVILITGYGSVKNAVTAMKKGAYSYFIKGNDPEELLMEIKKIYEITKLKLENSILKISNSNQKNHLTSKNKAFQDIIDMAIKASKSNANILILGESGVGKEVFARLIHDASDRSQNTFIPVNCYALQDTVLESELFGHTKGSFTGANEDRIGRFEAANGGTIFLDEIADTPLSIQTKLLRTIENKQLEKIGSNQTIDVDFRLITATNKNINKLIEKAEFRKDFYYRISTIVITIPPLRERAEDIPDLIYYFVNKYSIELKKEIDYVDDDLINYLVNYEYPGNVRELKNIIERLIVFSENNVLKLDDLPINNTYQAKTLKEVRQIAEKKYIESVLRNTKYNMTKTSETLNISRRQLFNKINELNIYNGK